MPASPSSWLPERAVLREFAVLAAPATLELVLESTLGVQDAFFVARLGAGALAAVGVVEWLLGVLLAGAQGLAFATVALGARHIGAKERLQAGQLVACSLIAAAALSALLGVLGFLYSDTLLSWMGADEALRAAALPYARFMLSGLGTFAFAMVLGAAVRAAGHPAQAVRALLIANAVNLVAAPLLIFGAGPFHGLGLLGAAVATNGARLLASALLLRTLLSGRCDLVPTLAPLRVLRGHLARLLPMALWSTGTVVLVMGSVVVLFRLLAGFGTTALAAGTISSRVFYLLLMPVWGIGNATAVLVGQRLGAADRASAETLVRQVAVSAGLFFLALALPGFFAVRPLALAFDAGPEVVALAVPMLRAILAAIGVAAFANTLWMGYIGAGEMRLPLLAIVTNGWIIRLTLAAFLSARLGPVGIFVAMAASEYCSAALGLTLLLRRGLPAPAASAP